MPTRRSGVRLRLERLALLLFTSAWVIVQNNSRISDNVPDDAAWSLLQIPRAFRAIEAGLLVVLFAMHYKGLARVRLWDFAALVWMFVLVALVSVALTPTSLISQLQGIYVYAAPFLLFGWAVAIGPTPRLLTRLIAILSTYLAINVAVVLFIQLPAVRTKSDLIHGLFSDAHVLGTYLAIFSCVAFSRFMVVGGVRRLLLAIALFLISYFPANEKMVAFNLAWWAAVLGWRLIKHPRSRRGLTVAATACGVLLWIGASGATSLSEWFRVTDVTDQRTLELGPVQSWDRAAYVVLDSPTALLVGIGPGNFAGVAAGRTLADQPRELSALSERARSTLIETMENQTALGWVANTWSNLLAEFGTVGFVVFWLALARLSWPVLSWRPETSRDELVRTAVLLGLGAIVWQGGITPYTNWSEPVLVYPVMVVAAYCHNIAAAPGSFRTRSDVGSHA